MIGNRDLILAKEKEREFEVMLNGFVWICVMGMDLVGYGVIYIYRERGIQDGNWSTMNINP